MDHTGLPVEESPTFITPYTTRFSNLIKACSEIDLHTVEILLNQDSTITNINEGTGHRNLTALHVCLSNVPSRYMGGRFQTVPDGFNYHHRRRIIDLLLFHGADPLARNNHGETPLHFSLRYSSGFQFLQQILYMHPHLNVNCKDNQGRTPLYWSCYKGLRSASRLLIEHGADVRVCTNKGVTMLHMPVSADDVDFFVGHGANLNSKGVGGFTPLHEAVHIIHKMPAGHDEDYEFLIARLRAILSHFPSLTIHNNGNFTAEELNLPRYPRYRQVQDVFDQHRHNVHDRRIAIAMAIHPRLGDRSDIGVLGPDILELVHQHHGHAN